MTIKNRNILINGGAGFIGKHLSLHLDKDNCILVPLRRKVVDVPFRTCDCDVTDYNKLKEICIIENIDLIINLVGETTETVREQFPRQTLINDYGCIVNSLELARELDIAIITVNKFPELLNFYRNLGTKIVCVEMCYVFGSGDLHPYHGLHRMFKDLIETGRVMFDEKQKETKQWIHVKDVVSAFEEIIVNLNKAVGKDFEIMDDKFFSVKDVFNFCNDQKVIPGSKGKNYGFFGWNPRISFDEGINMTYDWYLGYYDK